MSSFDHSGEDVHCSGDHSQRGVRIGVFVPQSPDAGSQLHPKTAWFVLILCNPNCFLISVASLFCLFKKYFLLVSFSLFPCFAGLHQYQRSLTVGPLAPLFKLLSACFSLTFLTALFPSFVRHLFTAPLHGRGRCLPILSPEGGRLKAITMSKYYLEVVPWPHASTFRDFWISLTCALSPWWQRPFSEVNVVLTGATTNTWVKLNSHNL